MKKDMRGKHGKQGRKATGRKRTEMLTGARMTVEEKQSFISAAKESGETQTDFILNRCVKNNNSEKHADIKTEYSCFRCGFISKHKDRCISCGYDRF